MDDHTTEHVLTFDEGLYLKPGDSIVVIVDNLKDEVVAFRTERDGTEVPSYQCQLV